MNSVLLLTRLQIAQSLSGIRGAITKRTNANVATIGTALLSVALFAGLVWLGYNAYGAITSADSSAGVFTAVYNILFLACGVLTFALSLPNILGTFFGSSDIYDLLPLPVSPFSIVLSKALSALFSSYLCTLLVIAGPLLGWGIAAGLGMRYWVIYILAVIFTPFMPVAYAGTISILVATVFKRVRRKDAITTIATVVTLGLSVGLNIISNRMNAAENVVSALGSMGEAMGGVVMAFPAYGFAVYAFVHPDPLGSWMFVLLSIAAFAVFVLVGRVVYIRIVTALSASSGKTEAYDGSASQEQTPVLKAMLRTEVRKIVRNSSVLLNYVAYPTLITPVLFVFVLRSSSIGDALKELESAGDANTTLAGFVLCGLMLLCVISGLVNRVANTAISREGSNWMHMKFIPVPATTQILAKMLPGFFVSALTAAVFMLGGGFVILSDMNISPLIIVCGFTLMLGASWVIACADIWNDSCNPNVEWGNDGDVNVKTMKSGSGMVQALVVGCVYSALPLLVSPLVKLDPFVFMPVLAVAGIAVAVVAGRMLLSMAARNIEAFE